MKINVFIKDMIFDIDCGDSTQSVEWLANVALFRYEIEIKGRAAEPKIFRLENGHFVELRGKICDVFHDDQNIWVILEDEYNPHIMKP